MHESTFHRYFPVRFRFPFGIGDPHPTPIATLLKLHPNGQRPLSGIRSEKGPSQLSRQDLISESDITCHPRMQLIISSYLPESYWAVTEMSSVPDTTLVPLATRFEILPSESMVIIR